MLPGSRPPRKAPPCGGFSFVCLSLSFCLIFKVFPSLRNKRLDPSRFHVLYFARYLATACRAICCGIFIHWRYILGRFIRHFVRSSKLLYLRIWTSHLRSFCALLKPGQVSDSIDFISSLLFYNIVFNSQCVTLSE